MGDLLLREVTLTTGDVVDVRISGGRIATVGPSLDGALDDEVHELAGHLLLPSAVEPHAHLDKAFLAEQVTNTTGDLLGAVAAMVAARPNLGVAETIERAERAARMMAANGYRAVRTHADTTTDHGLRSVEALVEVRQRVAAVIDIEIVALCGWPITGPAGADQRALLGAALDIGADLVGGCPHLDDAGTRMSTEVFLALAAEHAAGVDLHTDETLDPVDGLSELAEMVLATEFPHQVTASHCVSLGLASLDRQREVAEACAAAGIVVVALPVTNLYLQGREHQQGMPRGVTAVRALRAAGVVVAVGADNMQDPFNPLGRGDPFETAALTILTTHLAPADAWDAVSNASRAALRLPPVEIAAGSPADLLAVPASTVREAIAMAPAQRVIIRDGAVLDPS